MRVTIFCYGELRRFRPDHEESGVIEVPSPATVGDVVRVAGIPEDEIWITSVNDVLAYPDLQVHENDCVRIFAPITGG